MIAGYKKLDGFSEPQFFRLYRRDVTNFWTTGWTFPIGLKIQNGLINHF